MTLNGLPIHEYPYHSRLSNFDLKTSPFYRAFDAMVAAGANMHELETLVKGEWNMTFVNFVMAWHEISSSIVAHVQDEQNADTQRKSKAHKGLKKPSRRRS